MNDKTLPVPDYNLRMYNFLQQLAEHLEPRSDAPLADTHLCQGFSMFLLPRVLSPLSLAATGDFFRKIT